MTKKHRNIIISAIVVIYFILCGLWSYVIKEVYWKGGQYLSSSNIEESKQRGCFVETLTIDPSQVMINDTEYHFKEVWIENKHDLFFVVVLIPGVIEYPIFKNRDGFNINFNFENSIIPPFFKDWSFVVEGMGRSFGITILNIGNESIGYFSERIDNNDWNSINVLLTTNWEFKDAKKFKINKITQQAQ